MKFVYAKSWVFLFICPKTRRKGFSILRLANAIFPLREINLQLPLIYYFSTRKLARVISHARFDYPLKGSLILESSAVWVSEINLRLRKMRNDSQLAFNSAAPRLQLTRFTIIFCLLPRWMKILEEFLSFFNFPRAQHLRESYTWFIEL